MTTVKMIDVNGVWITAKEAAAPLIKSLDELTASIDNKKSKKLKQ